MKFGYCVNMIAQDNHGIGYEQLPMLKRVGFDYVELPLAQIMTMGDRAFRIGPLAALDSTGLPCLACNNFFPASYHLTGPQVDADSILAYANAALDRAAVMGAKRVVFGSAGARNMPLGFSAAEATEQLVLLLRRLAVIAESYGITLVIEHLNLAESNLINRFSQGVSVARRVNHPNVAVLVDLYHLRLAQEPLEDILDGSARLKHIHLARVLERSLPLPGDEEDYRALFSLLRQVGYDGTVSIEARMLPAQTESTLSESLKYLKECM